VNPSDRPSKDLLAFEALVHADAERESDDGSATDPRLTDAADAKLVEMIEAKLAGIGERGLAQARAAREAEAPIAIRPGLLAMVGTELRAHLRKLAETVYGGELVAAHRNLDEISDDDVRSMIADLEAIVPGAPPDGKS
jgi:hypothetical protein